MKISARVFSALASVACAVTAFAAQTNPQAVSDMLNRIGGAGTADRFVTVLDETLDTADGSETFVLTSSDGKPCIKGSTLSALTTGIGWYLNHTANVNLSWNNLTTDLRSVDLPLPAEETHSTTQKYRYYMNFCTFSYSASTWTWERWQKEIDWMALHGINMPLQIVGLEEVWRQFLMEDYGYSKTEANNFIAGPCFMAWFGMTNLIGHGGPNPDWWYERQAQLGKKMNARMKELGMEPVLPGYAGAAPSDFRSKTGVPTLDQGGWCGFSRPHIIDPNNERFAEVAAKFYARLDEVMGKSKYYAIDLFHEGANTSSIDVPKAYASLYDSFNTAAPDAKWVTQSWQWSGVQRNVLNKVPVGRLVVLDLYSDANPAWGSYGNHDVVYSTIFNFGARTGFFGRLNGVIDGFFNATTSKKTVRGIGASPEGIEQVPVLYDLLYELPWYASKPDAAKWMADYAKRRYDGADSPEATEAWQILRNTALDCKTGLQGPNEGIICSRPALVVNKVSTWGGAEIFYDQGEFANAAYSLIDADLSGENYSYDIAEVSRQALVNYSKSLLAGINEAHLAGNTELFNTRRDAFLQLILDIDELLCTNPSLTLGNWTERARAIADEMPGTTDADRNWLELDNARTIITTWGGEGPAGGLRDYSYRAWGGMLKDFYYQRWKIWFDNGMKAPDGGWFRWEWNWAHDVSTAGKYKAEGKGDTRETATRLMPRYLSRFTSGVTGVSPVVVNRLLANDFSGKFQDRVNRGEAYTPNIELTGTTITEIAIDFSRNTRFEAEETVAGATFTIPSNAAVGERTARITCADGTTVTYTVAVVEQINEPRTVAVASADPAQGSVSIDGTDGASVTNTDYVVVRATPKDEYDFDHWTDADGKHLGNDNPMTYYGKEPVTLTAHFAVNKWGVPDCSTFEAGVVADNGQYAKSLSVIQNGESSRLYATDKAPERGYISVPSRIRVAPGGEFILDWENAGGLGANMFFTAYADYDADGTFNIDSEELLGSRGKPNGNEASVGTGKFSVLVPYSAAKGTTHMRLRFDSSWNSAAYSADHNAMLPAAATNRLVYELLLDVADAPDYACTVTYAPNSPAFGTMRSENESMIYNPGEEVIITAFPNPGCHVKRWVDNHGRELPAEWVAADGLSVNFKTFDNAHITCEFEAEPLTVDGWKLDWTGNEDGSINITGVVSEGEPALDLSELNVRTIAPAAFASREALREITLPATRLMGPGKSIFTRKINGDGTTNKITNLSTAISGSTPWILTMKGCTGSDSFNSYGSALYGNGTDALADNFSNGWSQFYLTKDGYLQVKWDSGTAVKFDRVCLLGDFTVTAEFDGDKTLKVTATNSMGRSQTETIANSSAMKEISRFAVALPKGMNVTYTFTEPDTDLAIGTLFNNCHNLRDVHVPSANPSLREKSGVVFSKDGRTMKLYPEGRLHDAFHLKNGSSYVGASPVMTGGAIAAAPVATVEGATLGTIWRLEGDSRVAHANSALALDAQAANVSTAAGTFTHTITYSGSKAKLRLASASKTASYDFDVVSEIVLTGNGAVAFTLPFAVTVPDGLDVATVTGVTFAEGIAYAPLRGNVIAAGTPAIIRNLSGSATLSIVFDAPAAESAAASVLRGSCVEIADAGECFVLRGGNFVKSTSVPANGVYIAAADVPAEVGGGFPADYAGGETSISDIAAPGATDAEVFDLFGRRVTDNARPGIYIVNGKAVRK